MIDLAQRRVKVPGRRQRVTITDLAESLGLAKGTVSRALNGYPDISESTRLRVKHAAEAMGYSPLSHAQAIRTGVVRSVGLVLQTTEHDGHRPFLASFLAGISEAASEADWSLTLATASSNEDTERVLGRLVGAHKADGFILPRTYMDDPRIDFLKKNHVPFVLFGRTRNPEGCAWYDIESEVAIEEAVCILYGLGHRRIGFVPGRDGYTFSELRLGGYRSGLAMCGLPDAPELIGQGALNPEAGEAAARELLTLENPPTALVFSADRAAFGGYTAAESLGLKVGSDVSVVSYDGLLEGGMLSPALSTFSVDMRQAGVRLTELLIRRIRGEAPEELRELAQARFVARGSHGQPSMSPAELARRVRKNLKSQGRN
ncbi:LacI family DNA-binding transcriptional regulator [Aliiruegeria sabulilitoris]|uniref:LacI family DNA-binding transcriptional regulator n=1 Tax=Aliiruegeria sabulilitoris TaxID=1510458 RepID=UPI0008307B53|nr:substrate-binding domain-containing protein [Aliiruegeria sabulilitoris]NDR57279.1 LacI family transcriptional regulator [Pseudoruegeria sp. M32A2M]